MESNLWNKYVTERQRQTNRQTHRERETERRTDGRTERPRVAVITVDKDLINFHVCFLTE